ncbi:MAG: glycosyltransferase family 4 protein [Anaerolineae bacterium]|nr:glycosyltransferase family 4 protein [Anaerolineae bacterium]
MAERPLAFVVQRYGPEIVGGSEALCRAVAEMIAPRHPVEVLTTCARDYRTWRNELPAGTSELNGVRVRRFAVDFERDARFHELLDTILGHVPLSAYPRHRARVRAHIARSTAQQQQDCLKLQGPYSTPLLDFLASRHQDYGLVVFFTYLYPTTFFGCQQVPAAKTVLVPTAHDEAPIHLPIFRSMFARFPAHIFLTPEERLFVQRTFDLKDALQATIGMPVELSGLPDPERFRQKYGIPAPFLLYAGRIDSSKGCEELIRFFGAAQHHLPPEVELVLCGQLAMELPVNCRIRYLGLLSEQDKIDAMAAATLLVNPSPFESFSIVVLEAMLCGTPVLVNGQCEVLKGHVRRSRGGLYYDTGYEFVEALRLLLGDESLRAGMGANGMAYVVQNYHHSVVEERYWAALSRAERKEQG